MKAFTTTTSKVIPIAIKDVDTDMLIPAQYLTSTSEDPSFWGEKLFQRFRDSDPEFPLNLEKYKNAQIIVAKENFGCGSSREHAVWALLGHGIRVVIAPSFADIFTSNSSKNGLVLVQLETDEIEKLLLDSSKMDLEVTVSLVDQTVTLPNGKILKFEFDPFRKDCILKGLDDLDYILSYSKEIDSWNTQRSKNIFYSTQKSNR
jgi:3-isopropylmalate/(R)-2-methylmalate dehydratase small subunit